MSLMKSILDGINGTLDILEKKKIYWTWSYNTTNFENADSKGEKLKIINRLRENIEWHRGLIYM